MEKLCLRQGDVVGLEPLCQGIGKDYDIFFVGEDKTDRTCSDFVNFGL